MSAPDAALGTEGTDSDGQSLTDRLGIDPRYTVVPEHDPTGHLGKVVDPFVDMVYPANERTDDPAGVINHGHRWVVRQRPDGSGILEAGEGGTLYGIRTAGGAVVANEWDTSMWFPYKSYYHKRPEERLDGPMDYDYDWFFMFPFAFAGSVLTELTDIDHHREDTVLSLGTDEDSWVEGELWMRGVTAADILDSDDEYGVLLTHKTGVQVYIGYDSTAHRGHEMFGFVPFDGKRGVPAPSASDALDLLRPNRAAAGGSNVTRQGEWFLVPDDEEADGTIQKPGVGEKEWRYTSPRLDGRFETRHEAIGEAATQLGAWATETVEAERIYAGGSPLGNHVPRDWRAMVDDETFVGRFQRAFPELFTGGEEVESPQDCLDLLWEREDDIVVDTDTIYERVRNDVAGGVQVRGTIRHRENEHEMAAVDSWSRATTHEWDVVTVDSSGIDRATMVD